MVCSPSAPQPCRGTTWLCFQISPAGGFGRGAFRGEQPDFLTWKGAVSPYKVRNGKTYSCQIWNQTFILLSEFPFEPQSCELWPCLRALTRGMPPVVVLPIFTELRLHVTSPEGPSLISQSQLGLVSWLHIPLF